MLVSATVHPGTPESAMHHPNEPGIACRSVLRIYNPPDAGELLMSRLSERYLPIDSHDRVPRASLAASTSRNPSSSNDYNRAPIKPLFSLPPLSRSNNRPFVIPSSIEILPSFFFFFYQTPILSYEFERRREIPSPRPSLLFFLECLTSQRVRMNIYIYSYTLSLAKHILIRPAASRKT